VSTPERRFGPGPGITLGGIVVLVGVVLLILGYVWLGLVVVLVGLLAFGGFARGRWY